jgi:hypothetical protein
MQKLYSLNPPVVASELRRATRPTAAPRYSVSSIVIAQSRQTLNLWLACMHGPEFKAGRDWRVAQRFQPEYKQCGEQNVALKSRAFGPRTAAEARRAEAVPAKRLAQRFVLGVRSGRIY